VAYSKFFYRHRMPGCWPDNCVNALKTNEQKVSRKMKTVVFIYHTRLLTNHPVFPFSLACYLLRVDLGFFDASPFCPTDGVKCVKLKIIEDNFVMYNCAAGWCLWWQDGSWSRHVARLWSHSPLKPLVRWWRLLTVICKHVTCRSMLLTMDVWFATLIDSCRSRKKICSYSVT